MKYRLHDCAGPGACAVQHRDEISAGSVEGTEPSITATAGIELGGAVGARVYTPERSLAERIEFWGIIGWRARWRFAPPTLNHDCCCDIALRPGERSQDRSLRSREVCDSPATR